MNVMFKRMLHDQSIEKLYDTRTLERVGIHLLNIATQYGKLGVDVKAVLL